MRTALSSLALVLAISVNLNAWQVEAQSTAARKQPLVASNYQVSGPFTVGNLSLFLIRGADKVKGEQYLTLPEALAKQQVIVHETGNVNLLSIDNNSNSMVFIQSGEIVKGGQQDRALQSDMLVPPHTKNMQLPCFCVENGRWQGRVGESSSNFQSARDFVVGSDMQLAVKHEKNQSHVWQYVAQKQAALAKTLSKPVAAPASPSSLQLTLEQKSVKDATNNQIQALSNIVDREKDVIGYAVAINGNIKNADIYASGSLFKKLWPGLLKSAATEAVAEKGLPVAKKQPAPKDVQSRLAQAEKAPSKTETVAAYGHQYNTGSQSVSVSQMPSLQGATNGNIGPQGQDATYVTGVNTAGTVRNGSSGGWLPSFFYNTRDNTNGVSVHKNYLGQ